jgi:hypothetical protein
MLRLEPLVGRGSGEQAAWSSVSTAPTHVCSGESMMSTSREPGVRLALLLLVGSFVRLSPLSGQQAATPPPLPPDGRSVSLMVDPDLGMRSGIETAIAANRGFVTIVDGVVGRSWFDGESRAGKAGNVLGRLARYSLVDLPASYFVAVLAHELVGHGGRYRELGVGNIDYGFEWPPPYGSGGGWASTEIRGGVTEHGVSAIWTGGLETHALLQRRLALRWMARDEFDYADALLFWWSFQIQMDYVMGSSGFEPDVPDNDPRAYVRGLNALAGRTEPADFLWSLDDLKRVYRLNVLNPFVLLAVFEQAEMLWDGGSTRAMPSIRFGDVAYLPALRTGLTPFGAEVHLESYIRIGRRALLLDLARGDETFHASWWSAGATAQSLVTGGRLTLDAEARAWRQPELQVIGEEVDDAARPLGAGLSLRAYVALGDPATSRYSLVGEVGYKTRGFVEGHRMGAGPSLLLGLGLPW